MSLFGSDLQYSSLNMTLLLRNCGNLWQHCEAGVPLRILLCCCFSCCIIQYVIYRERWKVCLCVGLCVCLCVCASVTGYSSQMACVIQHYILSMKSKQVELACVSSFPFCPSSSSLCYITDSGLLPALHHLGIGGDFTSHTIKPTPIPLSGGLSTSAAPRQAEERCGGRSRRGERLCFGSISWDVFW